MDAPYPVERKYTHDKNFRVYMMRRSRAMIERQMTPQQKDAEHEIELAFRCIAGQMSYPSGDMARIKAPTSTTQEESTWLVDRYRKWADSCGKKEFSVVVDYILGFAHKEIAWTNNIPKRHVTGYLLRGLDNYCMVNKLKT